MIHACRSGAAEEKALGNFSREKGTVIIAATMDKQSAAEFLDLEHGVFTFVLLKALSGEAAGKDGHITANGIMLYIREEMPAVIEELIGYEMNPITFQFGMDFTLGIK